MAGNWKKIGTIYKSKKGTGSYLKVSEGMTLAPGQILQVMNPRKRPGITEEQLGKIPDYVLADLVLPPPDETK
jgi:hypothetical protein